LVDGQPISFGIQTQIWVAEFAQTPVAHVPVVTPPEHPSANCPKLGVPTGVLEEGAHEVPVAWLESP
jgi:hypothetical protein